MKRRVCEDGCGERVVRGRFRKGGCGKGIARRGLWEGDFIPKYFNTYRMLDFANKDFCRGILFFLVVVLLFHPFCQFLGITDVVGLLR